MNEFIDWTNQFQLPESASTFAPVTDLTFFILFAASVFFFVLIVGLTVYFCIKYRQRPEDDVPPHITHHNALEITWTIIPTIIVFGFFWAGAQGYMDMSVAPENKIQIDATAQKWSWDFTYPNDANDSELIVPVNQNTQVFLRSKDVIHSFFVPAFRVKMDVVPGRIQQVWFHPTKTGRFRLYCTEYCGTGHSEMITWVKVVEEDEYEAELKRIDKPKAGDVIFKNKCAICHNLDGTSKTGPPLDNLWGKMETMDNGQQMKVDEDYFIESLKFPNAKIVKGFKRGAMPSFKGTLKEEEFQNIMNFIKSQTPGASE